jgi:hypothetical protein
LHKVDTVCKLDFILENQVLSNYHWNNILSSLAMPSTVRTEAAGTTTDTRRPREAARRPQICELRVAAIALRTQ